MDHRDYTELALLSPQVTKSPNGGLSFAGQHDRFNSIQIDGTNNIDPFGRSGSGNGTPGWAVGLTAFTPEAVKELQVVTAPFDVRYGNFAGGLINAVTSSGLESSRRLDPRPPRELRSHGDRRGRQPGERHSVARSSDSPWAHPSFATASPCSSMPRRIGRSLHRRCPPPLQQRHDNRRSHPLREPGAFPRPAAELRRGSGELLDRLVQHTEQEPLRQGHRAAGAEQPAGGVPQLRPWQRPPRDRRTGRSGILWPLLQRRPESRDHQCHEARLDHRLRRPLLQPVDPGAGGRPADLPSQLRLSGGVPDAATAPSCSRAARRHTCQGLETGHTLWEITDNFGMAAGNHRLTFGTHAERIDLVDDVLDVPGGLWTFGSLDSLAQGTAASYLRDFTAAGDSQVAFRVNQIGVYAQDQWVPTPHLTVTAGLRLDVPFVPTPPTRNADRVERAGHQHVADAERERTLVSRLGVNYDPSGRGTTVLRGGVGFFAGPPAYVWFRNVYGTVGIRANRIDCEGDARAGVHARPEEPTHRLCRAVATRLSSRLLRSRLPVSPESQGGPRYGSGSTLGHRRHGGSPVHPSRELGRARGREPARTGRHLGRRRRPDALRDHRRVDRSSDTQSSDAGDGQSRPAPERQRRSLVLGHGPSSRSTSPAGPR